MSKICEQTPELVEKRNGKLVKFDLSKIQTAIYDAFIRNKKYLYMNMSNKDIIIIVNGITNTVCNEILKITTKIIHIEIIQDIVIKTIEKAGYDDISRLYNEYKIFHQDLREDFQKRIIKKIDSYIYKDSWEIKENSNMQFSLQGLNLYLSSDAMKAYWLNKIYTKQIANSHDFGDMHIHDLYLLSVYCVGWDLKDLLVRGFTGVSGKIVSSPAKHFNSALGQICNFLFTLQGEAAGAEAFSNFDTLLAPFVYYDNLTIDEVKKHMESFLYNMNVSTRVGFQTPFTNITMDLVCPKFMKDEPVVVGGKYLNKKYGDFQKEMDMINIAFAETMTKGDAEQQLFSFPIPTYCIDDDFDWDNPAYESIWKMTGKYGIPYFANYINSDLSKEEARSMCPLEKETSLDVKIVSRTNQNYFTTTIDNLYDIFIDQEKDLYLDNNNRKIMIKTPAADKYKRVTGVIKKKVDKIRRFMLYNKDEIGMDYDHLQYVRCPDGIKKSIPAKEITLDHEFYVYSDEYKGWQKIRFIFNNVKYDGYVYCLEVDNENHLFCLSNGIVTHNCRLKLDLTSLHKRGGGLFGANSLTGSMGVVTINLPRIGHTSLDDNDFFINLDKQLNLAKESLILKANAIEDFTEKGLFPYSKFYLNSVYQRDKKYWSNHFLTIGIIGMHEACLNFLGKGIDTKDGLEFAIRIMNHLNNKIVEFQSETERLFNIEASPAEGVSYSLYLKDMQLYPDMNCFKQENKKFYTNSTNLPVDTNLDLFEALDHQNKLQPLYTGGTVFHTFLNEEIKDTKIVKDLIKKLLSLYKIPYISLTPTFSICHDHGYIHGEVEKCPICGKKTLIYSRVVGYIRAVSDWNDGKQNEFEKRTLFDNNIENTYIDN